MSTKSFAMSLLILLSSIISLVVISSRPVPVVVQTNLENLPMTISGYVGTEDNFTDSIYRELNADKHVYRHYRMHNGIQLDLYIGYYGTAKGGRTGHNPYACLPGAGWAIVDLGKVRVRCPNGTSNVEIEYLQAKRGGVNTVVVHWYQTDGNTVISSGLEQNILRFIGRIIHNRNDGAFVRISATVIDDNVLETKKSLQDFAENIMKLLPMYWPLEM
jgi:EpsI family protein